jgi:16S rRNA G966 N2-methylase RsmD
VGLEAASRGASHVIFAECAPPSLAAIRQNCRKAAAAGLTAGLEIVEGALPDSIARLASHAKPDIVFADPPYPVSSDLLAGVTEDDRFARWADSAALIWELPSERRGFRPPGSAWRAVSIRNLGAAEFLFLVRTRG